MPSPNFVPAPNTWKQLKHHHSSGKARNCDFWRHYTAYPAFCVKERTSHTDGLQFVFQGLKLRAIQCQGNCPLLIFLHTVGQKKVRKWSQTALKVIQLLYLLTIISSPTPVARQSDPATLVAIFSSGNVTIGRPAQRISVPVVCALHKGLKEVNDMWYFRFQKKKWHL